ncbi:MAG TPA: peptidoglycan editing factor PgeF [bacterium]
MQPPSTEANWQPFEDLAGFPGGISLKRDGSMSWNGQLPDEIVQNRRRYFEIVGLDPRFAVGADQVHGAEVYRVTMKDAGRGILDRETRVSGTDALITNERGLTLTTLHADCAPVFFADPKNHAIGLAHAGRRGILAGVAGKTLQAMSKEFGSIPGNVHVAIGPTICTQAYEVSLLVAEEFAVRFGQQVVWHQDDCTYLDLVAAIMVDLLEAGLNPSRIPARPPCTATNPLYASYRRDGAPARSMLSWLRMM